MWGDVGQERGATALMLAAGMLLFLGMAALAVDYGLGVNERRQDQTAADAGATAGAVEAAFGVASNDNIRDNALSYVASNLPTTYGGADWQALWESCVDPAAERNSGGYNFIAVDPPSSWSAADPANWCISIESSRGLIRVRVPDQLIDTAFAPLVGVAQLRTAAVAVSRVKFTGQGGILPFGLPAGATGHYCLSSGPAGISGGPCEGSQDGDFGTLQGKKFGNPETPSTPNCTGSPLGEVLAQNISHGYDHIVRPAPGIAAATEIRDQCTDTGGPVAAGPGFANTLETDTGFPNNGAEQGLFGPVPAENGGGYGGYTPRMAQGGGLNGTTTVFGKTADDTPLWWYLRPYAVATSYGPDVAGDDGPASCDPATFTPPAGPPTIDWDSDGIPDPNRSWQHMQACLREYAALGYSGVIFQQGLGNNRARFGYVPQFHELALGPGSKWLHVDTFRAVYLQATTWGTGAPTVHNPGQGCAPTPCIGTKPMTQMSAFVIPDSALPHSLRGSTASNPGLNPFTVELFD